jgi:hypothetical protein
MGSPVVTLVGLGLAALATAVWLWRARLRRRRSPEELGPVNRPIEQIAVDVRRRGERFHALSPHASYVKVSALSSAYDHVLGECCDSLGQSHLLSVLQPGPELDRERRRVELVLHSFGLPVHHAA